MRLSTIVLLMIFLTSCKDKFICKQLDLNQFNYLVIRTVKLQYDNCKIQCFDLNNWRTVDDSNCGENFKSGNYPLDYCNEVQGFSIEDMANEVRPKIKNLAQMRKDYCKF